MKRPSQIIPKLNPSFKAVFVTFCGKYSIKTYVEERGNKFSSVKSTSIFLSNLKTGIRSVAVTNHEKSFKKTPF